MMKRSLFELFSERKSNGRDRRASQKSEGSTNQEPNTSTGRAETVGAYQGTKPWSYITVPQGTSQGTSIMCGGTYQQVFTSNSTLASPLAQDMARLQALSRFISAQSRLEEYLPNTNCQTPSGKWCPPWMPGELGRPNNARNWRPREIPAKTDVGVVAGEILAWRAWYWDIKKQRLRSIFVDYHWPIDGPARGEPWNGYGIHSFKTKKRVGHEYGSIYDMLLVGEVELWGDVVEFDHGYTSEFAKPISLFGNYSEEAKTIYGV